MAMIMQSNDEAYNYRHKKFDVTRQRNEDSGMELTTLSMKQELLSRTVTPCSYYSSRDDESSNCSSDYSTSFQLKRNLRERCALVSSTPLPKRRKLAEDNSHLNDTDSLRYESNESSSHSSSTVSQLPHITSATLRDICKYHGNMVRKFPKKERTPKDQERRNKNTIACRMSRRVKKLEHLAIEEQYKEFQTQHMHIVEQSMRAAAYFSHLNQLAKLERPKSAEAPAPPKNFSIDYLISDTKKI